MTIAPMTKRIIASLCLSLLAASVPPIRHAVLNWAGTTLHLPELTYASGLNPPA